MAIICTVETNDIWSYILNALRSKGIERTASSQRISNNLTLLTTPLRTSELLDLCSSGEDEEIYVFFSSKNRFFIFQTIDFSFFQKFQKIVFSPTAWSAREALQAECVNRAGALR